MTRSNDITSFTEFHAHLRDHLDQRKATGRPLFVTINGETEVVVLSPAAFNELMDQADPAKSLAALDLSMDDIKTGRVRSGKDAIRHIATELNLALDR